MVKMKKRFFPRFDRLESCGNCKWLKKKVCTEKRSEWYNKVIPIPSVTWCKYHKFKGGK